MILSILISWVLINHYPSYASFSDASPVAPDLATCTFPTAHYPAFLVCTQAVGMNLSNETVMATFTVEASPDAVIRFAGEGVWNFGPRPASARMFFSSVTGYNNQGTGSTNYWFNSQWVEISTNMGIAMLIVTFTPSDWTDAGGCNACPPPTEDDFWFALSNVHEVGLAFGGGDFYDVGIAATSGSVVFHLNSFAVAPKFKGYRNCFSLY